MEHDWVEENVVGDDGREWTHRCSGCGMLRRVQQTPGGNEIEVVSSVDAHDHHLLKDVMDC